MRLLEHHNCADYLRDVELVDVDEAVSVQLLTGGVSNVVFHVHRESGRRDDFALKQARGQLRVEQPWFCSVERIWREVEVLRVCRAVLQSRLERALKEPGWEGQARVCVPEVLFEDRDNYAFAMTAAPGEHTTWKEQLLAGRGDETIAAACGELLGRLHAGTWRDKDVARRFGDREYFMELRVKPYYRRVAEVHPDLAAAMKELIRSLDENRCCLVHGDFSPKNLLVWADPEQHVMLIDCEVGHYGDPAFDLGFMLSHLTLKAVYFKSGVARPG